MDNNQSFFYRIEIASNTERVWTILTMCKYFIQWFGVPMKCSNKYLSKGNIFKCNERIIITVVELLPQNQLTISYCFIGIHSSVEYTSEYNFLLKQLPSNMTLLEIEGRVISKIGNTSDSSIGDSIIEFSEQIKILSEGGKLPRIRKSVSALYGRTHPVVHIYYILSILFWAYTTFFNCKLVDSDESVPLICVSSALLTISLGYTWIFREKRLFILLTAAGSILWLLSFELEYVYSVFGSVFAPFITIAIWLIILHKKWDKWQNEWMHMY